MWVGYTAALNMNRYMRSMQHQSACQHVVAVESRPWNWMADGWLVPGDEVGGFVLVFQGRARRLQHWSRHIVHETPGQQAATAIGGEAPQTTRLCRVQKLRKATRPINDGKRGRWGRPKAGDARYRPVSFSSGRSLRLFATGQWPAIPRVLPPLKIGSPVIMAQPGNRMGADQADRLTEGR